MNTDFKPDATVSIMLVDDTAENLRLLADLLDVRGYDVRPYTSGAEALEGVAHTPPDLILLDITMPGMDGFEVCRRLKEDYRWQDIPVIFLTALNDVENKVKGFSAGAVDYITKPFNRDEVLARVATHIALRRAHQQLAENLERLKDLERLRDDLVNMIIHDMRSPLTVMSGYLQILRLSVRGDDASVLGHAISGTEQLRQMTNTLLDVSRLEAERMPIELALCDVAALADSVRTSLHAMEPGRVIVLNALGSFKVHCDSGLIRRVLENLVSNGIKHTPPGEPILIKLKLLPDRVRVAVRDQGAGVPPELQKRIFEKFGAVRARKDKAYHSAGLGLAFCKLAVEAHGGSIGVDSVQPNGSEFWFELPLSGPATDKTKSPPLE